MRDFILRIISRFQGRGAEEAQRGLQGVEQQARQTQRQADPGRFRRFFTSIQDGARRSGRALGALILRFKSLFGLGLVGFFGLLGRSISRTADEYQRFGRITGTTNKEAQQFIRTAQQNQVSVGALESGLRSLNRRVVDMADAFAEAGIQTRDNEGNLRQTRDIFLDLADVISNTSSAQRRASITQRLMGDSGQQLIPILREGREAIEGFMDATRLMSDQTIERVNKLKDEFEDLKHTITVSGSEAGNELVETIGLSLTLAKLRIQDTGEAFSDLFRRARRLAGVEEEMAGAVEERSEKEKASAVEQERRQASIEEALDRTRQINRIQDEFNASLGDERSERERLADVQDRISELTARIIANEEGSVEAARERVQLKEKEAELQREVAEQDQAERQLQTELEIMRARAAGDESRAEQLEREKRARELTRRIVDRTGRSEAEAAQVAWEKLDLEERIAASKERQRQTDRQASRERKEELSEEERQLRELLRMAARDPLAGGASESARARRELQEMGVISRTQRVADEQLLSLQRRMREGEDVLGTRETAAPRRQDVRASTERVADSFSGYHESVKSGFEQLATMIAGKTREIERLRSQIANARN